MLCDCAHEMKGVQRVQGAEHNNGMQHPHLCQRVSADFAFDSCKQNEDADLARPTRIRPPARATSRKVSHDGVVQKA